jgi:hypothetical protein
MHACRTQDLLPLAKYLQLNNANQNIYYSFMLIDEARVLNVALFVWSKRRDSPIIDLLEKASEFKDLN